MTYQKTTSESLKQATGQLALVIRSSSYTVEQIARAAGLGPVSVYCILKGYNVNLETYLRVCAALELEIKLVTKEG